MFPQLPSLVGCHFAGQRHQRSFTRVPYAFAENKKPVSAAFIVEVNPAQIARANRMVFVLFIICIEHFNYFRNYSWFL